MKHWIIIVFAFALSNSLRSQHFVLHAVLENAINVDTVAVNSNYVDSTVNAAISSIDLSQVEESQDLIDTAAAIRADLGNVSGDNVYNTDGTLTGNRTINLDGNSLSAIGGDIGIGTTTPSEKLEIVGNTKLEGNMTFSSNPSSARYILLDQNHTGDAILHMQAGKGSAGHGGSFSAFGHSHPTRPGWSVASISASSGTVGTSTEGRFVVTANALAGGTELFTVLRSGPVGIGTTAPASKLHVLNGVTTNTNVSTSADEFIIEGNSYVGMTIISPDANIATIQLKSPSLTGSQFGYGVNYDYTSNLATIGTNRTGADFRIRTSSAIEAVRILSNGNVGIGTVSASEALEVDGNVKAVEFHGNGSNLTGIVGDGFEANTDNQTVDTLNLNGTTLEVSISGDDEPVRTLDLSSLSEGDVEAMTAFPYNSGFANVSSYPVAEYYKDRDRVYLKGVVGKASGFNVSDVIGVLPVGYRPNGDRHVSGFVPNGAGFQALRIESNGEIIYRGNGGQVRLAIDNISFRL